MATTQSSRKGKQGRAEGERQGRGAEGGGKSERSLAEVGKETIGKNLSKDSEAFVERARQHGGE